MARRRIAPLLLGARLAGCATSATYHNADGTVEPT